MNPDNINENRTANKQDAERSARPGDESVLNNNPHQRPKLFEVLQVFVLVVAFHKVKFTEMKRIPCYSFSGMLIFSCGVKNAN